VTEPVDLAAIRSVHVIGAGGAGMSAIATVLAAMGKRVTGSDLKDSAALRRLAAVGVEVHVGHHADALGAVDAVAISTAVPPTNPEVVAAGRRGIPVLRRADVLAAICRRRPTVAVAGTHGKTTTSSMLALILVEAGLHPSFLIGGEVNEVGGGAVWDRVHDDGLFVVEADESDGTFVELPAHAVVVTNLEPDHLDYWGTFAALQAAFERFVNQADGPCVVGVDDPASAALAARTGALRAGTAPDADWRLVRPEGTQRFSVVRHGSPVADVELAVPGLHNARNALVALASAVELGAPVEAGVRALERYAGVARRWQHRGHVGGIEFVDDYAHLPTEVAAAISAGREGPWSRVVAVFQPHRFTRTASLGSSFGESFIGADVVFVTEIFPAGEPAQPGVTGRLVVDAVQDAHPGTDVIWAPGRRELIAALCETLRAGDLCLTLGAGDLTSLADEVIGELGGRSPDGGRRA